MVRKYVLPVLAVLGVVFGIYMVKAGNKPPAVAQPVTDPARSPFAHCVTGAGLVEAATENIQVGTPVAGVVTAVYRQVGDPVRAGLPHELVRRLVPLVTTGSADEAYDDTILAAPIAAAASASATQPADLPATQPGGAANDAAAVAATVPTPAAAKVNVNTAPAGQIAALPGVGPAAAERVVAGRPYASAWDLEGTPLFKVDDRAARADLAVKVAAADQARQKLNKLLRGYRQEEVRMARAQQEEAQASYDNAKRQYERWSRVEDAAAVPPDEVATRRSAMVEAEARVRRTKVNLEMLQAGSWEPDVQIARAELQAAEAQVRTVQTEIDRLTVRAPVDGQVLQVKVRPGEYAPLGVMATPLMLVGRTDVLHIRTDVDEHEAMRVRPDARAMASIRGDGGRFVELRCVRVEPYVIPKRSLTGDSSERVDTRVLQIVYAFDPKVLHAYVGQQMDVFVDAGQADAERAAAASKPATGPAR
jgi:HlyD family secretion protein